MARLVVLGTSLGGVAALETLLRGLADFPLPIVVVQHRSSESDDLFASVLSQRSPLPVLEAEDKTPIRPGTVYLAPADYHLLIDGDRFALSTEGKVQWARPSIDVLFDSAAAAYGPELVAVVLTGASEDGARGLERVKALGGTTVVQEPGGAESGVMPRAALARTPQPDRVLPIAEIAPYLQILAASRVVR